ncbi:MAG TPA: SDR family NAD(P)-dependent oxidoreductase [Sphingomonadales bacterium]
MRNPLSILITGASSGIGRALAVAYARPGVTLFLGGRSEERLAETVAQCAARGAKVKSAAVDVTDAAATAAWIAACDNDAPLDLVIANAGISLGDPLDGDLGRHTEETFAVNVTGVFNTIHPAIPLMRRRKRGQIAIMSSLAGYFGMGNAPAYSASKVAVRAYGEALRGLLRPEGIAVNVICPGFIRSPMTARNDFPMPFLMTADKAAEIIRKGLAANRGRIAFPFPMLAMVRFLQMLPASWLDFVLARLPAK